MRPDRNQRRGRRSLVALGGAAALALTQVGAATAQDNQPRDIDAACQEGAKQADPFLDVSDGDAHAEAINCLWVYGIVQGQFGDGDGPVYNPGDGVNRQQMASFVAQGLDVILDRFHTLPPGDPDDADDRFADGDEISDAHASNVVRLHDAGIVTGYDDDTYRPGVVINRAQMAAFLARSIEDVIDGQLPRTESFDDAHGTHQEDIEKLASIGVAAGTGDGEFSPAAPTTRAQMASFVARSLDYLATEGYLVAADYASSSEGSALWITDAAAGEHDGFDRAAFYTDGSGEPGWNARYVDEAVAQGSGHPHDIEGEAIIELWVTGATYPEDPDDAWMDEITVNGEGIVEVVGGPLYEGRHQIWIGTTDLNAFDVNRADDGDLYIDVDHG